VFSWSQVGSRALSSEASTAVALADPSGKPPSKEPRKVYNPLVPLNVSSDPLAAVGEEVAMPNYYVRRSKDRFARSSRKLDLPIVLKTDYEGLGKKGAYTGRMLRKFCSHRFERLTALVLISTFSIRAQGDIVYVKREYRTRVYPPRFPLAFRRE
jgi:hypothetical protein